jgi:hypothetical protein
VLLVVSRGDCAALDQLPDLVWAEENATAEFHVRDQPVEDVVAHRFHADAENLGRLLDIEKLVKRTLDSWQKG